MHHAVIVITVITSDLFRIESPGTKGRELIWPQVLRQIADGNVFESKPFKDLLVFVAGTKHKDSVVFLKRPFMQKLLKRLPIELGAWGK